MYVQLLNASRIRTPIAKLTKSIESKFDRETLSVSLWMHRDFQMCIMHSGTACMATVETGRIT